jgi:hypothetical protein
LTGIDNGLRTDDQQVIGVVDYDSLYILITNNNDKPLELVFMRESKMFQTLHEAETYFWNEYAQDEF